LFDLSLLKGLFVDFFNQFNDGYYVILYQMALSVVIGVMVGLERSYQGRAAGARTYALVCLASMLIITSADMSLALHFKAAPNTNLFLDNTRVIQGVLAGIGFLGAGVIVKDGFSVRGLTTAATIWIVAILGILVGLHEYFLAIMGGVFTIVILTSFKLFEKVISKQKYFTMIIRIKDDVEFSEEFLIGVLKEHKIYVEDFGYKKGVNGVYLEYKLVVRSRVKGSANKMAKDLVKMPEILDFEMSPTKD